MLIGFDTEYVFSKDVDDKKNVVLSYQFHAILPDLQGNIICEWSGICYPEANQRISRQNFFSWIYTEGLKTFPTLRLPDFAYLVGHFTRADLPAFVDFKEFAGDLDSVRNTFITMNFWSTGNRFDLHVQPSCPEKKISISLRDTYLLCPSGKRSLRELGDLLGLEKISLPNENDIENMDKVLERDRGLYERYAIRDAKISAEYALEIIKIHVAMTLARVVPLTLSSIGVAHLLAMWKQIDKNHHLNVLGKEQISDRSYSKNFGSRRVNKIVKKQTLCWEEDFVTDCYHGGRNEQYFFGPSPVDNWSDFDLASAYPTAMSLIAEPDWDAMAVVNDVNLKNVQPTDLSYFCVEFEFPEKVRFPSLPIRSAHGLIFPLKGVSCCSSPELVLARNLGATLEIKRAVFLPVKPGRAIFKPFTEDCLQRRRDSKSDLEKLFWKEISNSTYGKTAQGLRDKKVFNCKSRESETLPESKITNPFFASFVTSFVRATLGEIMNQLPSETIVSNCTTDGILCNALEQQVLNAAQGPLCQIYAEARNALNQGGNCSKSFIEVKHRTRQILGWRTRGQATLEPSIT